MRKIKQNSVSGKVALEGAIQTKRTMLKIDDLTTFQKLLEDDEFDLSDYSYKQLQTVSKKLDWSVGRLNLIVESYRSYIRTANKSKAMEVAKQGEENAKDS